MFAQWISRAFRESYQSARTEALITLGSAPLELPDFRSLVLGQLGEPRLAAAIATDIAGSGAHSRALDADTRGPLRDVHRRVGTAILFESSGGQVEKLAHLPELRFALGEPEIDTTSSASESFGWLARFRPSCGIASEPRCCRSSARARTFGLASNCRLRCRRSRRGMSSRICGRYSRTWGWPKESE